MTLRAVLDAEVPLPYQHLLARSLGDDISPRNSLSGRLRPIVPRYYPNGTTR
jgi:hypothetical protein